MATIKFNELNQSEFDARVQDILDLARQVQDAVQDEDGFDSDSVLSDLDSEMDGARLDLIALIEDVRDGNTDNSPDED